MRHALVDTGPLVALLNRRDQHHAWALEAFSSLQAPACTCDAVLSEACFLVRRLPGGPDAVLELVERGAIIPGFALSTELSAVRALMKRYRDVPMSLADACLVRMSEDQDDPVVLTLDHDFQIYRRRGRRTIPLIAPF